MGIGIILIGPGMLAAPLIGLTAGMGGLGLFASGLTVLTALGTILTGADLLQIGGSLRA